MIIIGAIILSCGLIGGLANYHRFEYNKSTVIFEISKSLLTGVVASATVPLFLNMVSSNLMEEAIIPGNELKYFIFGGFCLIAAFFSNRFLQSISDRMIQDLQKKTLQIKEETLQNSNNLETIINNALPNGDLDDEILISRSITSNEIGSNESMQNIMKAFKNNKYSFRTLKGISNDAGMNKSDAKKVIEDLREKNVINSFKKKDGTEIYSIKDSYQSNIKG